MLPWMSSGRLKSQAPEEIEVSTCSIRKTTRKGFWCKRNRRTRCSAPSKAYRVVLVLREYEQLSYQDIASTLDIPIGTVMSRLNYARERLRLLLRPHGGLSGGQSWMNT